MRVDQGETIFWHSLTAGSLCVSVAHVVYLLLYSLIAADLESLPMS